MSIKSTLQLILISIPLFGCNSQEGFAVSSPTVTPTIAPAVAQTQLAMPITAPTFDSVLRISNDFLPPSTPLPSATPTNVFVPVANKDRYSDLVITLQRQRCLGRCPVYSLTIYGDGTGVYEGETGVKVEGIRKFTVSEEQLAALVTAFDAIHYFSLDDFYSCGILDVPITATSITFQGHSKAVGHSGGCVDYEGTTLPKREELPEYNPFYPPPLVICEFEHQIEEIVNAAQWTGR